MRNKDEIIAKYLSGNATEKEREEVEALKNSDDPDFLAIEQAWQITEEDKASIIVDQAAAWKTFNDKKTKVKKRPAAFFWLSGAVVIISVILTLLLLQVNTPQRANLSTPHNNFISEVAATDSVVKFYLPDGSKVILNNNSRLFFPEKFYAPVRVVRLEGEGYFEVKRDERPFMIYAGNSITKVLGTAFNLKAYKNDDIEVTVIKGSVEFSKPEEHSNNALVLNEKESGAMDAKTNSTTKRKIDESRKAWWQDQVGHRFKKFLVKVRRGFKKEN